MIPSLVVGELRAALVEYLSTTFALADDDVRDALSAFLHDAGDGIFRGPYVRVHTPYRPVAREWEWPLDWRPPGFVPHVHQGQAFERLSTLDGRRPQPTIVTTGTGSGKTEAFLYPLLDHCARARRAGTPGIKALILYPMNALASDQAGRIASLIHEHADLGDVTAGIYVGDIGRHDAMGPDHLVDLRQVLRADPPDVLLTNYKMLDFLLLRREDRDLWALNQPDTLRYVVLDEFHTYDGAQGTDVAMLLRRLGRTLRMNEPGRPLGSAAPVATSATLGSGVAAGAALRDFAAKVFGLEFDEQSVIGEQRQTVEEACGDVDYLLPIPDAGEVAGIEAREDQADVVAAAFCRYTGDGDPDLGDPVVLGQKLLSHPLTRAVLAAVGSRSRTWPDAVAEIITRAPSWGATHMRDPAAVEEALARYLWLLSMAKRRKWGRTSALFSVDVQLWVREVSRLLREVRPEPRFRWRDAGAAEPTVDRSMLPGHELPAVYCRRCGLSGWMAVQADNSRRLNVNVGTIYAAALDRSPQVRVLLRANPDDPAVRWYDPGLRLVSASPGENAVAVLFSESDDDAKANRCPACTESDGIRFLGLRTASLASVSMNTIFGSPHVVDPERKLLAFTDSVQDASHRAAFFAGRTHRINLRISMAAIAESAGSISVADLGDELLAAAGTDRERFGLVPPDLLRHPLVRTVWTPQPDPKGVELLRSRLGFEVDLEFGLRARVGRTLELSRVAAAAVDLPDLDAVLELVAEDMAQQWGELPATVIGGLPSYVRGLLERLRLRGGLRHPMLEPYVADNGRIWHVWGGRPDGLPPFPPGQGRPLFFTTAARGDFDGLIPSSRTPTWLVDWAGRSLGIDESKAATCNQRTVALLAHETDAVVEIAGGSNRVFALDRRHVVVHDIVDEDADGPEPGAVRCGLCGGRQPTPPHLVDLWVGTPCLRYRCAGRYDVDPPRSDNYYRALYRSGATRRVVTAEHTGLLRGQAREDLERAFKFGVAPDAPNVIAATPTLEMGIDIGDLSAVMLANVPRSPAAYAQRIGRAGRASGNSLITTFVRTDTHGLYYLSDPDAMLSGEIRPPDCYLDALDTLRRQYIAFLLDRIADLTLDSPPLDLRVASVMKGGFDEGGLFRVLVTASELDLTHVSTFLDLFRDQLAPATVEAIRAYAAGGLEVHLKEATGAWSSREQELAARRQRLTRAIEKLDAKSYRSVDDDDDLHSLRGQRQAAIRLLREHRNEYTLSALERLGVLPNYTLIEDGAVLQATMWSRDDDGKYDTETISYTRPASIAVQEMAPGNSFYADGHRHVVDALDVGSASEPLYETWRMCPDCGYGKVETTGDPVPRACPRCAAPSISDTGSLHTMLRLRAALASSSEEGARVYDEDDDRRRERYDMLSVIDIAPEHISEAWCLDGIPFGAELASAASIRTVNLGFRERRGETLPIAGEPRHITRFNVCRHCGAVASVRDDRDGTRPERLHQGWCKVRSGSVPAQWDDILLYHELVTEGVRMLLPVSLFEVEERLVSFTGALLIGLREDFGGEPSHLNVVRSSAPNRSGQGRRRFLVLYDAVPGGTGYLARLADPERVRAILEAGRRVISTCRCQHEGRAACHRCLLGVVNRNEYDLARRELALELLDGLLEDWSPTMVATVADLDLGQVEESELERRFKVALRAWVEKQERESRASGTEVPVTMKAVPGVGSHDAFELRFQVGGQSRRYRVDEQAGLSTSPSTIPDFKIQRLDAGGPDVAIYLDGYQFHASAEHNNLAADARKRAGVRVSGRLVWNLTWDDVERFHKAALSESTALAPTRPLLTGRGRQMARDLHFRRGGLFDYDLVDKNPVECLIEYLRHPDLHDWERLAQSAVGGAFSTGAVHSQVDAAGLRGALRSAVDGAGTVAVDAPAAAATDPWVAVAATAETEHGHKITCFLRQPPDDERWTVVSSIADGPAEVAYEGHRLRWQDHLQWANILQFLRSDGREVVICASSMGAEPLEDLWILDTKVTPGVVPARPGSELDEEIVEELDFLDDDATRALVEKTLLLGVRSFVAGYEFDDGTQVDAGWPDQRIGVMASGKPLPAIEGWDIRSAGTWTVTALADALRQ
jgi:hypothetical protein